MLFQEISRFVAADSREGGFLPAAVFQRPTDSGGAYRYELLPDSFRDGKRLPSGRMAYLLPHEGSRTVRTSDPQADFLSSPFERFAVPALSLTGFPAPVRSRFPPMGNI
jgi:hypothetical protein